MDRKNLIKQRTALALTLKQKWIPMSEGKAYKEDCACCLAFRNLRTGGCGICPIAQAAGEEVCRNTPFDLWREYIQHLRKLKTGYHWEGRTRKDDLKYYELQLHAVNIARMETEFLQNLLSTIDDEIHRISY